MGELPEHAVEDMFGYTTPRLTNLSGASTAPAHPTHPNKNKRQTQISFQVEDIAQLVDPELCGRDQLKG